MNKIEHYLHGESAVTWISFYTPFRLCAVLLAAQITKTTKDSHGCCPHCLKVHCLGHPCFGCSKLSNCQQVQPPQITWKGGNWRVHLLPWIVVLMFLWLCLLVCWENPHWTLAKHTKHTWNIFGRKNTYTKVISMKMRWVYILFIFEEWVITSFKKRVWHVYFQDHYKNWEDNHGHSIPSIMNFWAVVNSCRFSTWTVDWEPNREVSMQPAGTCKLCHIQLFISRQLRRGHKM